MTDRNIKNRQRTDGKWYMTDATVTSGGTLTVNAGGTMTTAAGSTVTLNEPTLASPTITGPTIYASTNLNVSFATATTAELTGAGGKTLIPAVAGHDIRVMDIKILTTGNYSGGGGTGIKIQDTADVPVDILAIAKAGLTDGAKFTMASTANCTWSADWPNFGLTSAKGLRVIADGAITNGTSVTVVVFYTIL